MIGERIQEVTDIYYEYYDRFYDVIKDEEGGNAYTVFQIWGPGRTVKLQCDFSAMMSPEDFRKYIVNIRYLLDSFSDHFRLIQKVEENVLGSAKRSKNVNIFQRSGIST